MGLIMSNLPNGANWDDSQRLIKKLAELKLRGNDAEQVRAEYARRWEVAAAAESNPWAAEHAGRAAANAWLGKVKR